MKNHLITVLMITASIVGITSQCKKEQSGQIGKRYEGGIIAYILQPGDSGYDAHIQHGLIAAPTDQATVPGVTWCNGVVISIGTTSPAIGAGKSNTDSILVRQGIGSYAAYLCDTLTLGGYTDWYLPSENELEQLYLNRTQIGGFSPGFYWNSTEWTNGSSAWIVYFVNSSPGVFI